LNSLLADADGTERIRRGLAVKGAGTAQLASLG
jgi:hypothetical protein